MDINTCLKYDTNNIILEKPEKVEDIYISNLNFTIQTPKLEINKISKKLILNLNEDMEKLLNDFDNKIINLISENSNEFFEEQMTEDEAEEIYKGSFKKSKLNVSINKKLNIYNKSKDKLELNSLTSGDIVICLLKCKKLIFYKNYCEPLWEVFQIKLKEVELDLKSYLFLEDDKDTHIDADTIEDDYLTNIKNIKIKN